MSPNMKPNISGVAIATTRVGSASPAAGTPSISVNTSNGRIQRGFLSRRGAS